MISTLCCLIGYTGSDMFLVFRMANNGRTIIMSIHQPRYSIYQLFDNLTLLVSGKLVYHGPAHDALDYFTNIGTFRNLLDYKTQRE